MPDRYLRSGVVHFGDKFAREDEQPQADRGRPGDMARRTTDARGAVTVEYTVLLGAVALAAMGAIAGLGVALSDDFELVRSFVLYPYP